MKYIWNILSAALFVACVVSVLKDNFALDDVTKTFTFSAGDTIKASRLNANWDTLYNAYNRLNDTLDANFQRGSDSTWKRITVDTIIGLAKIGGNPVVDSLQGVDNISGNPKIDSLNGPTILSGKLTCDTLDVNASIKVGNSGDVATDGTIRWNASAIKLQVYSAADGGWVNLH